LLSFFAGLSFPAQFNAHAIDWAAAGQTAKVLGDILQALLTTGMAVTAILAIFLDNVIPGATIAYWEAEASDEAWEKAEIEWKKMAVGEERKVFVE